MGDMEKLCRITEEELNKIAEKGLNTANLETAFKLSGIYKNLKNTEYWDVKKEYYMTMMGLGYSHNNGHRLENHGMTGLKHDSMGRYSRDNENNWNSYNDGESYRQGYSRNQYSRDGGGYSGNYDRYMDSKQSYRASKSPECKQRLMTTLEEYMDDFSRQMEEMLRDSDCAEERTTIKRYLDKIKGIA